MKVVINGCFGGFALSHLACEKLHCRKYAYQEQDIHIRSLPALVHVVEELGELANGESANGESAQLKVISIPDDVNVFISDYDGLERIEEVHRVWS